MFRMALPFASTHEIPVITVLALRDEASMQEPFPDFWEKGHVRNAGLFVQRLGKAYIVLRLDLATDNSYETIYHEYFHSITTPYYPYLPLWLSEGLAEFFGNAEINPKDVTLGRVNASLLRQLNGKTLIPLTTPSASIMPRSTTMSKSALLSFTPNRGRSLTTCWWVTTSPAIPPSPIT